ncbi:hypothetical protein BBW68_07410 [Candidatus Erwinia dacicola]|uniref:Uncharacterized protein n=1 Tax=Candidatus Erwinia dacicola TaxID=252393 RepID=A0A1E7Z2H8_9GAMM|nr:hypothetical protein BBW68_07410 [Candidatus Erwinia dacicola]RAP69653.1 hypothetical protein ACZ87_03555 [Candidatus Erwinia dacicola]
MVGLLKSIRRHVTMDKDARATMSSASDKPKKTARLQRAIFYISFSLGRYAVHVINNQSSQNQIGNYFIND